MSAHILSSNPLDGVEDPQLERTSTSMSCLSCDTREVRLFCISSVPQAASSIQVTYTPVSSLDDTALMWQHSVAKPGTASQTYERNTWPELARLATDLQEAGVHFQGRELPPSNSTPDLISLSHRDRNLPPRQRRRHRNRRLVRRAHQRRRVVQGCGA